MNILFIGAHHDDLEFSIGASVYRWVREGNRVASAILTNSVWKTSEGILMRSEEKIVEQCAEAAELLGYKPYNLMISNDFELRYDDTIVLELLKIIKAESIDTLIAIWPYDAHPTHRIASEMAFAASRKIPRILTTRISWNSVPQAYKPNFFVDVTDGLDVKIEALKCYKSEFMRRGADWEKYIRSSAVIYGLESGYSLAEAFEVVRYGY